MCYKEEDSVTDSSSFLLKILLSDAIITPALTSHREFETILTKIKTREVFQLKKSNIRFITTGAVIAALYVALTLLSAALGMSSGAIQVRISEALCILPCFTPAAIPGLFLGCLISNIIVGSPALDIIAGSVTTLAAAAVTYLLRRNRFLASLPPIVLNALFVPVILSYAYGIDSFYLYMVMTVGLGELVSAGLFGQILYSSLDKRREIFNR